jgi:hypothetical protein
LIIAGLVAWQHAQKPGQGSGASEITYGVEDATEYIYSRLDPEVSARIGTKGVRRIVEWEIFYLQGLAQPNRRHPIVAVAGDYPPAVAYIGQEIANKHGLTYSGSDIGTVLEFEASYLESIGAVGEKAGGLEE